jgi:hypothetical protein
MQSYQCLATVRAVETVGRGKSTPAGFVFGSSTFPYQPSLHNCSMPICRRTVPPRTASTVSPTTWLVNEYEANITVFRDETSFSLQRHRVESQKGLFLLCAAAVPSLVKNAFRLVADISPFGPELTLS